MNKNKAFSLIEVVISVFILSLVLVTLLNIIIPNESILNKNNYKILSLLNSKLILDNYQNVTYKEGNIKELIDKEYNIQINLKQYLPLDTYKYSKSKINTNSIEYFSYDVNSLNLVFEHKNERFYNLKIN